MTKSVWLADDIGMQSDAHDKWLLYALFEHFIKMVDDHLRESRTLDLASYDHRDVVDLLRIGYSEERAVLGAHEDGLIIHAPVEEVGVAMLGQKIRRGQTLRNPGAEPALGGCAFVVRYYAGRLHDKRRVVGLAKRARSLRICAAMTDEFVASRAKGVGKRWASV
jgi:hypothetical protein